MHQSPLFFSFRLKLCTKIAEFIYLCVYKSLKFEAAYFFCFMKYQKYHNQVNINFFFLTK